jgi:hypothetical protein
MKIVWTFIGHIEWILNIHNNCIFPYYGYSMEIVIQYGYTMDLLVQLQTS